MITLCGLLTSCGHILPFVGIETESYRPLTASTTRTPNCMADDIVSALGGSVWDPNVTVDAPTPGYPPRYSSRSKCSLANGHSVTTTC
ncbi:hypothetical protein CH305_05010 [Rhodococcus sp. 15-649-2-2]|nr:hypothetical protein CH305_05010 [Rhodococcus sp. 15-649-2-2]